MLWQFKLRDKESDLYTVEDIQRMFRDDELKKDTMVRPQNLPNWVPLGTVAELQPPREGASKARFALENVAKRAEENAKMLDLPDSMTKYISADIMRKRLDREDEDRPRPVSTTNLPRLTDEEREILNENRSATIRVKNTHAMRPAEPSPTPARPAPFPVRSSTPVRSPAARPVNPGSPAASPARPVSLSRPAPEEVPAPAPRPVNLTRPGIQVHPPAPSVTVEEAPSPLADRDRKRSRMLALIGAVMCALAIICVVSLLVQGGDVNLVSLGLGLLFGLGLYPLGRYYISHR